MEQSRRQTLFLTTGRRRDRKVEIIVVGKKVPLSMALFEVFLDLVCAFLTDEDFRRIPSSSGDPENARLLIHRLRSTIDRALGPGIGRTLIQTGLGTEYRLALSPSDVAIDEGFFSLPPGIFPLDVWELIREHWTASEHVKTG